MGQRIGIIAGSGEFPLLAVAEARRRGLETVVAAIRGEAEDALGTGVPDAAWFEPGELGGLVGFPEEPGDRGGPHCGQGPPGVRAPARGPRTPQPTASSRGPGGEPVPA